jgi:hypothetical protein
MMQEKEGVKSGHREICHMSIVPCQGMDCVVNALEIVVVITTVREGFVGEYGVVCFRAQKLICAGTEPGGMLRPT